MCEALMRSGAKYRRLILTYLLVKGKLFRGSLSVFFALLLNLRYMFEYFGL